MEKLESAGVRVSSCVLGRNFCARQLICDAIKQNESELEKK